MSGRRAENANAKKHGRFSAQSREIRALGRVQFRTGELLQAQLALTKVRAQGDPRSVTVAEERISQRKQQLVKAAVALDRVLAERGDDAGRRFVEGALRRADHV